MQTMKRNWPMPRRSADLMPHARDTCSRTAGGRIARIAAAASTVLATLTVLAATGPVAAQSVVKLSDTAAAANSASAGETAGCGAGRYHAAFAGIRDAEYQALKNARETAAEPDQSLPGRLLFTPVVPPKSNLGRQALMTANQLARSQNRPGWMGSTDARWVMKEVTNELGRYLSQDETEFLCGGVPDYLKTLRSYLVRFGGDQATLEELKAAQAELASASILAARAALRPVPLPTPAPADRAVARVSTASGGLADPVSGSALRPALGLPDVSPSAAPERPAPADGAAVKPGAGTDPSPTGGTVRSATADAGAGVDPELPPLRAPQPVPLASDADRLAALDSLLDAARRNGALNKEASDAASPATVTTELPPAGGNAAAAAGTPLSVARPVLARLAALRPLVYGSRTPIGDVAVRRQLIDVFSAVEILDYLDHRPAESDDSVPAAIGRTLDAIAAAHAQNCGCASN